ncbi:MAG: transcription-repair coupling factor [Chloroflexi bacterium]|nr:transcription-repair coupling factor [Chloroflexota bacterium]
MDLTGLLGLIEEMPAYRRLTAELRQQEDGAGAAVLSAARPYLIAALYRSLRRPVLVVTAQPEDSKRLHEQLLAWCDSARVRLLPEPDALPYQRIATDTSTETERVQALSALGERDSGAPAAEPPLVVSSAPALMHRVAAHGDFVSAFHAVAVGMRVEPLRLLQKWEAMGYRLEDVVEVPGAVSHRGGIVDVYPPTSDLPARIEFFGSSVDGIRLFDPASQRSLRTASSITVGPATEALPLLSKDRAGLEPVLHGLDLSNCAAEVADQLSQEIAMLLDRQRPDAIQFYAPLFNRDSIMDYLPHDALIIVDEPADVRLAAEGFDAEAEELRREKVTGGQLPRNFPRPYFTWPELEAKIKGKRRLALSSWDADGSEESRRLGFASAPGYAGRLPSFLEKAGQMLDQNWRLIIVSNQASRLAELFAEQGIIAAPVAEVKEAPPPGSLTLAHGSLAEGWAMDNETCLFTDAEIFGFVKQRRLVKRHPVPRHRFYIDMNPGDYVVHVEHGIARFVGIVTRRIDSSEKEYLVLRYAAGDKLYVPTDQIDRVSRYIGASDRPPALDRLGGRDWIQTTRRVRESARDIARELLALYAAREVSPGFAFSADTVWQRELEASFPYVETPDQAAAAEQVKADMERPKPMDRLVCGDVGYGKTEVAIRAAFKTVLDGKQVAVLAPTTVLAQQHLLTFRQRLAAFPVRVEVLSRFLTPREQKTVLEGLGEGAVDICIGTHRLLQKDVVFKELGLLIIDEEQRFGVAHKEHLKKMRREVDVLSLSATPIPRTLHMSLAGIRDMSVMETPPDERLPVKTYVADYDDRLVREAILRELERNGQVFFVHNRVQGIDFLAGKLQSLVPEARIAVAHGQMPEEELEAVMADFALGKSDVLVCTTIIESGLDIPNVNTIIVNRADKLGLTQLYQLRGRVGRGANLAYAYFLYDRERRLTPTARKRLRTIYEAAELGAGFGIAMKDLEIRGAGTLLGVKQSGHISAVGFDLYTKMLAEAVEELRAKQAGIRPTKPSRLPSPTIDLPLPAYIPEDYVSDLKTRLGLYRKMAALDRMEQVETLAQELGDRFGAPPPAVVNLLYALKIKVLAAGAGIESVSTEDGHILLKRFDGLHFDRRQLEPLREGVKLGVTQLRLNFKRLGGEWQKVLVEVLERVGHKCPHML